MESGQEGNEWREVWKEGKAQVLSDLTSHSKRLGYYPCPKNMAEAQLKTLGLTACAEEISRRPNVGCVVWLLAVTLMEICNEKEPSNQGKLQKM